MNTAYVKSRRLTGPRPVPEASVLTSAGPSTAAAAVPCQQLFRHPLVDRVTALSRANAARLADSWVEGEQVDVAASMTDLAQRNILEALLGSSSEHRLHRLAAASRARRRAIERLFFSLSPLPEYHPTRVNLDSAVASRLFDRVIAEELARGAREDGRRPPVDDDRDQVRRRLGDERQRDSQ